MIERRASLVVLLSAIGMASGPFQVQAAELSRIELPRQAEVIGTYDEQTQVLTCVTPHGHISGHLAPTAITSIKPLSSSEAADDLAHMQKLVDQMITEAKEHEAAKPPAALPGVQVATPFPQMQQGPAMQPGQGPQGPPRVRRNRALRQWQPNQGNPNQGATIQAWGGSVPGANQGAPAPAQP